MAFPQQFLDDLERGKAFLSDRNVERIADLRRGCSDCKNDNHCISWILRALDYKVELDQYDDIAKDLHDQLVVIIGDYVITIKPQVYAGIDKVTEVGEPINFTAQITLGSGSLVSIVWTKVYGDGTVVLTNANTATVTALTSEQDDYVLQVEITDSNGFKANDTVKLTSIASAVGSANIFTTPKNKYSTASSTVIDLYSILVVELIGADISEETGFFEAHRGVSLSFGATTDTPDDDNVNVDTVTGIVTFAQPFNPEFIEVLRFDYKTGGTVPPPDPTNSLFNSNNQLLDDGILVDTDTYNLSI